MYRRADAVATVSRHDAAWVARRVPDGYIGGHANQARITTFPLDQPDDTKYSPDLIAFARRSGHFPPSAPDAAPLRALGSAFARPCDACSVPPWA